MKRVFCFAAVLVLLVPSFSATAQSKVFRTFLRGASYITIRQSISQLNQLNKETGNSYPYNSGLYSMRSSYYSTQPHYFFPPLDYSPAVFTLDPVVLSSSSKSLFQLTTPPIARISLTPVSLPARTLQQDHSFRFLDFDPRKYDSTTFDGQFEKPEKPDSVFHLISFPEELFGGE